MGGETLDFNYNYKNEFDCFISEILSYKPVFVFALDPLLFSRHIV